MYDLATDLNELVSLTGYNPGMLTFFLVLEHTELYLQCLD